MAPEVFLGQMSNERADVYSWAGLDKFISPSSSFPPLLLAPLLLCLVLILLILILLITSYSPHHYSNDRSSFLGAKASRSRYHSVNRHVTTDTSDPRFQVQTASRDQSSARHVKSNRQIVPF